MKETTVVADKSGNKYILADVGAGGKVIARKIYRDFNSMANDYTKYIYRSYSDASYYKWTASERKFLDDNWH